MRRHDDVADLVSRARRGEARSVARLISLVEAESPALRAASEALAPHAGRAHVVGLTGSPGVGKSTTTSALVTALRRQGRTVGVLAVDPSSPFTGGALLGDRIRMEEHATDPGVYLRSMASRGHLGGLSWATPQAIRVLDVAGCDVIVVETVGVGQSEVEIAALADTTLVLLAPGMGDGIQAAKAGILEVGDVFCVNKADRDGATTTRRELRTMLSMTHRPDDAWKPPILMTTATSGEGIDETVDAIDGHLAHLRESGELRRRRHGRARREIERIALAAVSHRFERSAGQRLDDLAGEVLAGTVDPFAAADALMAATPTSPPGAPDAFDDAGPVQR